MAGRDGIHSDRGGDEPLSEGAALLRPVCVMAAAVLNGPIKGKKYVLVKERDEGIQRADCFFLSAIDNHDALSSDVPDGGVRRLADAHRIGAPIALIIEMIYRTNI